MVQVCDLTNHANEVKDKLNSLGGDVSVDRILKMLHMLHVEYKVPIEDAKRTVLNSYMRDLKLDFHSMEAKQVNIADIPNKKAEWVSLKAKVMKIFDPTNQNQSQVGYLGDSTGSIRFVVWAKSSLPKLEEGKCYYLKNVKVDKWSPPDKGVELYSVSLNKQTHIAICDENIEAKLPSVTITGAVVDIQDGSGIIKRCPQCRKVLIKGICQEHGKQDGVYDIRIKGIIDDGYVLYQFILNSDMIKSVMGIDVAVANKMAMDAMDPNVVKESFVEQMLGRYYTMSGSLIGDRIIVTNILKISKSDYKDSMVEMV